MQTLKQQWNLVTGEVIEFFDKKHKFYISTKNKQNAFKFTCAVILFHFFSKIVGHYPSIILDEFAIKILPIALIGGIGLFFVAHLTKDSRLESYAKLTLIRGLNLAVYIMGSLLGFLIAGLYEQNLQFIVLILFSMLVVLLSILEFLAFIGLCYSKSYKVMPSSSLVSGVGVLIAAVSVFHLLVIL